MQAVIFRRSEIENGSLLLNVLNETGSIKKLKIPGILKSKSRNAYFLTPATIWNFTLSGNDREIATPKEYHLIHAPYEFNAGYKDLLTLGEILKPVFFLKSELEVQPVFEDLSRVLLNWKCGDESTESLLIHQFYLKFLKHMGLLHYSLQCVQCGDTLSDSDHYHLFSGSICENCLRGQRYKEDELIPNSWFAHYISGVPDKAIFSKNDDEHYRKKILLFIKNSI